MSNQPSGYQRSVERILGQAFTDIDCLERLVMQLDTQDGPRAAAANAFRALHMEHGTMEGLSADDTDLLADVRANAERLLSALTRWWLDLAMSGSVAAAQIDAMVQHAQSAMEAFAAAPAAAPGSWTVPALTGRGS